MKHKTKKINDRLCRPKWDEYFLGIAALVARRSTCLRRNVGAVLVKDKRILTTGYNGAPSGLKHCEDTGCLRDKLKIPSGERHELCRALHAEMNAILQAAQYGIRVQGSIMYCTNQPCVICAKMIVNSGIKKIVINANYPDKLAKKIFSEAKVKVLAIKKKRLS
ncbi:MAG: cytidine/deoxycytidylate deaminase family protein [Candidatus Omnitrophica bacterium]|nr:cytidine/deoxycytidylate deaminase family protein [Candidatus Omnitrophota bacterium]MBU1925294.1 cytidine/deoxycytidylate deaminase family protein [Candidatus Omnitrophota bacterium]